MPRPGRARAQERRRRVFERVKQGYSLREIARIEDVSLGQIQKDRDRVVKELERVTFEDAERWRLEETAKLKALWRRVYPEAVQARKQAVHGNGIAMVDKKGNPIMVPCPANLEAIKTLLKINESIRKMWGLDKPQKVAITTPDGMPLGLDETLRMAILKSDELTQIAIEFTRNLPRAPADGDPRRLGVLGQRSGVGDDASPRSARTPPNGGRKRAPKKAHRPDAPPARKNGADK